MNPRKSTVWCSIALILISIGVFGQTFTLRDPAFVRTATASGGCSTNYSNLTDNDYWYGTSVADSQFIQNSSGRTVCSVQWKIQNTKGENVTATVEFWSGANRTGTQYGTASLATTITGGSVTGWYNFTWSTPPTLPASDYHVTIVFSSFYDYQKLRINYGVASHTYCMYSGATVRSTSDSCVVVQANP